MKIPISAVVFTKNESENIRDCIASLRGFSEIVVVDSMSSDGTKDLALALNARVVDFSWNGFYPKKRQWSLENIKFRNDWILFIDADERVTPELFDELSFFMQVFSTKYSAGSISIDYFFTGKILRFGQRPKKTVLLKVSNSKYPFIEDLAALGMGELEGHYQPIVIGRIKRFSKRLLHNGSDPVATWMVRHVNYANWEAFLLQNRAVKSQVDGLKGGLVKDFHKLPFRPVMFFVYSYFFRLGFLDGRAGFDYAFAKAWYYWLSGVIAREGK